MMDTPFKTHTELGYMQTQGNTDTQAFSLDFVGKKGWGQNNLKLSVIGQYAQENSVESKNKLITELTYDYDITDRIAFDYLAGFRADRFSGFDSQFYTGPGAKYKVLVDPKQQWNVSGNILYARDTLSAVDTVTPPVPSYTNNYTAYTAKTDYTWQIVENLLFAQELSYRSAFNDTNNYFFYSKSGVASKINSMYSMGASYTVDYKNAPPAGKQNSDKTFIVSLNIDY